LDDDVYRQPTKNRVLRKEYRREDQCLSIEIQPYRTPPLALRSNCDGGSTRLHNRDYTTTTVVCIVYIVPLLLLGVRAHALRDAGAL